MCIFTNLSTLVGCDSRSIFKWSLTGLNFESFFSKTGCSTIAKEPSLTFYLPIGRRENN